MWPSDVISAPPAQLDSVAPLDTVFEATMEFSTEMVLPVPTTSPPAFVAAVPPSLVVMVEFVIVVELAAQTVHRLQTAPTPPAAVLFTRVELSTMRRAVVSRFAKLSMPPAVPPVPFEAKLRLSSRSECVTVSVPPTFAMPAPEPPVVSPRSIKSSLRVSVPSFRMLPPTFPFVEVEVALPNNVSSPEIVTVGVKPFGWMSNTRALAADVCCSIVVVRAPAPAMVRFCSIRSSPFVSE